MHRAVKRALVYMSIAAACYFVATFFTDSRAAFVVIFGVGLALGILAELIFWTHIVRLPWKRARRRTDGHAA